MARVFKGLGVHHDEVLIHTAELTGLTMEQVRTALRYYAEHVEEVDAWIQRVDEEAALAEAACDL